MVIFVTAAFLLVLSPDHVTGRSQNDTGLFRKVAESYTGYEYLSVNVTDARSLTTCATSCLRTDDCTGYVFDAGQAVCQLVAEFCGGSVYKPTGDGQLYTLKQVCPTSSGYHYVDLVTVCEFCLRLSSDLDLLVNYQGARNACNADGGTLLHFEDVLEYDLQKLLEYIQVPDTSDTASNDRFWLGINSLLSPGQLTWDESGTPLTEEEVNNLPWNTDAQIPMDVPVCLYLTNYFQEVTTGKCDETMNYVCMVAI
ncbi:unnamed protein product [Lymnaea stagnalis]|uniref:C-type lectin domain-containing protein n=1 Tax=Lymnaea stagnalis TaxID=6523 RepID=A0AAV2HNG6_LYMST